MTDIAAGEVALIGQLTRDLTDEIVIAMGLSPGGWARRLLAPVLWLPAHRFATLAAGFDRRAGEKGLPEASAWLLSRFVEGVHLQGFGAVPTEGPLVVAANHPGGVDGLAIAANLPRADLKVVASGIDIFRHFPAGRLRAIYAPREGSGRMTAVRQMLRHLEGGGSLLIFPSGNVDPDPATQPGAGDALNRWSPSLELILRRLPETRVLIAIVSGVLSPRWLQHPLVRLRHGVRERQKLAEFLQTMQQTVLGQRLSFTPRVSFAQPVSGADLRREDGSAGFMPALIERARMVLDQHLGHEPQPASVPASH